MSQRRLHERGAGLLAHPTSLSGPFESGDLGPSAHAFVDFIAGCGQSHWMMLPLGPAGPGGSPYSSTSVFAGSFALVSLERLRDDGLLDASSPALTRPSRASGRRADFGASNERREQGLREAFARAATLPEQRQALHEFRQQNTHWLADYALFAALKQKLGGRPFFQWPQPLARKDPKAVAEFAASNAEEIAFQEFVQLRFAKDLEALVAHARDRGVSLIGDAPIYVAHDSAEVWAHPELFQLDANGEPAFVAGVPPDAFSDEGQLWGNPLYDWAALERTGFQFWISRLAHLFRSFSVVRLDHFIGFSRYYAVPRSHEDAKDGVFHDVPGRALIQAVFDALGGIQLIAEDLGIVTDAVRALRDHFRLPGMNVLQFSFSPEREADASRPHHYRRNSIVFTGTHDNDTLVGWFSGPPADASQEVRERYQAERAFALEYVGVPSDASPQACAEAMVLAAMQNQASTAIFPVQDVLGLGRDARMNRPGVADGNWDFRLLEGELSEACQAKLRRWAEVYGRGG